MILPQNPEDMAYPRSHMKEAVTPLGIFIPRRELLLKMMRACIGVTDKNQLWYN